MDLLPAHIPIQTLAQPIQQPLALALAHQQRAVLSDPIPLDEPLLLLFLLELLPRHPRETDEVRVHRPFLVAILLGRVGPEIICRFADREAQFAREGVLVEFIQNCNLLERWGCVFFVRGADGEAPSNAFLFLGLLRFLLQPAHHPRVPFQQRSPQSRFRQNGPVGEGEGAAFEGRDDGVAHVADKDGHGGDGDERPDDEEGLAGVAGGREVPVADGEEGDVAEVEGFEVAEVLSVLFGAPKTYGADAPEHADCDEVSRRVTFRIHVRSGCKGL